MHSRIATLLQIGPIIIDYQCTRQIKAVQLG